MSVSVTFIAIPATLAVIAIWIYAKRTGRKEFADLLMVGAFAGLIGTFAYDLSRVPFHIFGQRIFAPISAYGVWILDAPMSSRFTEVVGWAYHFWNGIMFGVMYAMLMAGRSWLWAVLWGCGLETIAFVSPFGRIFGLWGNWSAIGVAYLGHVAYGIPLGKLIQHWKGVNAWLLTIPLPAKAFFVMLCLLGLVRPILSPEEIQRDNLARIGQFQVYSGRLNPDWQRIQRGETIAFVNGTTSGADLLVAQDPPAPFAANSEIKHTFEHTGVFPVAIKGPHRNRFSFVIVEPVEKVE
jgi:hypothetical protein